MNASDTWGIPGPTAVWLYIALITAALIAQILAYWRVVRRGGSSLTVGEIRRSLSPAEIAELADPSGQRAVTVAIASLLLSRSLTYDSSGIRLTETTRHTAPIGDQNTRNAPSNEATSGPPNRQVTRAAASAVTSSLTTAVINAVAAAVRETSLRVDGIVADRAVDQALYRIDERLADRRLILIGGRRRFALTLKWWQLPVLAAGIARLIAGVVNHHPVGTLVLLLICNGILQLVLLGVLRTRWRTRLGQQVWDSLPQRWSDMAPRHKPSWSTIGPQQVAMAVAVFGGASVWAAFGDLANAAGIERHSPLSPSSSTGSSSSCSTYSSHSGCSGCGSSSSSSSCGG